MERIVIQSSQPRALKTDFFFFCMLTFFRPPCLKSELKVSFFIFGLEGHRKVFCILFSSLIISAGAFDINERKTIFEISHVLKTIILPSSLGRRILQTFKTFRIFFISLFLVVQKVDFNNCYGIITQIITLHATNCHFHTFQFSNTCNFKFFMI